MTCSAATVCGGNASAEKQRRKRKQVIAPDNKRVCSRSFNRSDGEALLLCPGRECPIGGDQAVVRAAGDPEQPQICLLCIESREMGVVVRSRNRRTHAADPGHTSELQSRQYLV